MKFVLLITFALMPLLISTNVKHCQMNSKRYAYNTFFGRHIIEDDFDRTLKDEWEVWESHTARRNNLPCQQNDYAYDLFVYKHIIQDDAVPSTKHGWAKYLEEYELCHRPVQSFIKESDKNSVISICNGGGYPLEHSTQGNLCMSDALIPVYDLKVTYNPKVQNKCEVVTLTHHNIHVIVACDKFGNRCLPVHYEGNNGRQRANKRARRCGP